MLYMRGSPLFDLPSAEEGTGAGGLPASCFGDCSWAASGAATSFGCCGGAPPLASGGSRAGFPAVAGIIITLVPALEAAAASSAAGAASDFAGGEEEEEEEKEEVVVVVQGGGGVAIRGGKEAVEWGAWEMLASEAWDAWREASMRRSSSSSCWSWSDKSLRNWEVDAALGDWVWPAAAGGGDRKVVVLILVVVVVGGVEAEAGAEGEEEPNILKSDFVKMFEPIVEMEWDWPE